MTFKQSVHNTFLGLINQKIKGFESKLAELKESVQHETKSTAGDKHETARAHLQIEQEQTNQHLLVAMQQRDVLEKLDPAIRHFMAIPGALVITQAGSFYISTALGKQVIDDIAVIALSIQSPLGMKMKGCRVGDRVEMNGVSYVIKEIV